MSVFLTNPRLTYPPPHALSTPRPSPTSVANLRLPAADFSRRFKSNFFSAELSSPQTRSVPVPVVFSDQQRRRSMEPSNVYVSDSFFWFCSVLFRRVLENNDEICRLIGSDKVCVFGLKFLDERCLMFRFRTLVFSLIDV